MENITAGCACKKESHYWVWPSPRCGFSEDQAGYKKVGHKYETDLWRHEIERPWHNPGLYNWAAKPVWIPIPSRRGRRRRSKECKRGWTRAGSKILISVGESQEDTWHTWEWRSDETYIHTVRLKLVQGKREASRYYNEKNREGKKSCRRDKRNLIESTARETEDATKNNDLRTLYMTTRKLSGIRCNQNRPIRSEDGTVLT